jgi:RNA polymerase sigma factor (sigma-70 family)
MKTAKRESWHSLVESNQALVMHIVKKYWNSQAKRSLIEQEEVFLECCLILCKAAKKYVESNDERPFIQYAYTAIKNNILDMLRDRVRQKRMSEKAIAYMSAAIEPPETRTFGKLAELENKEYCKALLSKANFEPLTKKILYLFYWKDMSYEQIGKELGMSFNEVSYCLVSAKKQLKEALCEML